jgi:hypothetical protein
VFDWLRNAIRDTRCALGAVQAEVVTGKPCVAEGVVVTRGKLEGGLQQKRTVSRRIDRPRAAANDEMRAGFESKQNAHGAHLPAAAGRFPRKVHIKSQLVIHVSACSELTLVPRSVS